MKRKKTLFNSKDNFIGKIGYFLPFILNVIIIILLFIYFYKPEYVEKYKYLMKFSGTSLLDDFKNYALLLLPILIGMYMIYASVKTLPSTIYDQEDEFTDELERVINFSDIVGRILCGCLLLFSLLFLFTDTIGNFNVSKYFIQLATVTDEKPKHYFLLLLTISLLIIYIFNNARRILKLSEFQSTDLEEEATNYFDTILTVDVIMLIAGLFIITILILITDKSLWLEVCTSCTVITTIYIFSYYAIIKVVFVISTIISLTIFGFSKISVFVFKKISDNL